MTAGFVTQISEMFKSTGPITTDWLSYLLEHKLDRLPPPGDGMTLVRWRALSAVAEFDLSLAKLYEGHTDALAILHELDLSGSVATEGQWCVWAAETPNGRSVVEISGNGHAVLNGAKHWCSGAHTADHALVTAWNSDGTGPYLIAIDLNQPGIDMDGQKWRAVGMAKSMSVNVSFDNVKGQLAGDVGDYLRRPGFWHGGAGVASCWYGGAVGIASTLRQSLMAGTADKNGFKLAAFGKVALALEETAAVLRKSAKWIDDHPAQDASQVAFMSRLSAEKSAKLVIEEVGKAMGASPFCLNQKFAQAMADLPVFIRQSHAERDFVAFGCSGLIKRDSPLGC